MLQQRWDSVIWARAAPQAVAVTGTIESAPATPPAHAGKYAVWMERVFGSAERFTTMFSVPLLVRAARIRGG